MIYWTVGAVVLLYVILLVSRLIQVPVSTAQDRELGLSPAKQSAEPEKKGEAPTV